MKKTILFASALFALLLTTSVSGQGVGTGGDKAAGGSGSTSVGGAGTGGSATTGKRTYPKVFVSRMGKRTLLAGNLFKGVDQKIDLTFDILDSKGKVVPDNGGALSSDATNDKVVDADKLKGKGYRLRVKGAGKAVEFYPF